jgi:hypothetical protein
VSLHHCVDHGCRNQPLRPVARHPSPKFSSSVYQRPRYDEDTQFPHPEDTMDSQLASQFVLGAIGLIGLAGLIGTVLAFWSMGRAGYRKD